MHTLLKSSFTKTFFAILVVFLCAPKGVYAANLVLSASPKTVSVGDRVSVNVFVDTKGVAVNAISGSLTFSSEILKFTSVNTDSSIVSFWTTKPVLDTEESIFFEGVILNPGYTGASGKILTIDFKAMHSGQVSFRFPSSTILTGSDASNVAEPGGSLTITVKAQPVIEIPQETSVNQKPEINSGTDGELLKTETFEKRVALPVITDYSGTVASSSSLYVKGVGEPNAMTKIVFKDVSAKSLGENFITLVQNDKKKLDEVLVKNDEKGLFNYVSPSNLVAGVYNATPFFFDNDTNTEKPGLGVQMLVSDSQVVRFLIVLINVLGLLIPIVALIVVIYFIPWYSWLRMRVLRRKTGLEEEKIQLLEHQLKQQERFLEHPQENHTHQHINVIDKHPKIW